MAQNEFTHPGLKRFIESQEHKNYMWHFEDPKKPGHKVLEELFCDYEGMEVIVVKCESFDVRALTYYAILGKHDKESNDIIRFAKDFSNKKYRAKVCQDIKRILKLTGRVDIW